MSCQRESRLPSQWPCQEHTTSPSGEQTPFLQASASEQSSSLEQDAPETLLELSIVISFGRVYLPSQWPAQEQVPVDVGCVAVVVAVLVADLEVVVGVPPEPPDSPRLETRALTSLSPMDLRVLKLVM